MAEEAIGPHVMGAGHRTRQRVSLIFAENLIEVIHSLSGVRTREAQVHKEAGTADRNDGPFTQSRLPARDGSPEIVSDQATGANTGCVTVTARIAGHT
jgi:hypothetical protein